jgi:peptidoglycan/LPS O-acetylase OafA/YrhL
LREAGWSLGLIGLLRRFRWLADASYWIYLAHLPLVIALESLLIDAPRTAVPKFLVVNVVSLAVLLVSYRWCVRYSPIGWLLTTARSAPRRGLEQTPGRSRRGR